MSMKRCMRRAVLALAILPLLANAFVDDFSKLPEIRNAAISPGGDYLAVLKEEDEKRVVAVFTFPAMKLINVIDFPGRSEVGTYSWVNDERLLVRVDVDWGNREDDVSYGELYAVNADGKKGKYLYGIRGNSAASTQSRVSRVTSETGSARLIHPRWDDPKEVLVELVDWNRGFKSVTSTAVMDVYTGRITQRTQAPNANAQLVADYDGNTRFSFYIDDDQNTVIHYLNPETNRWEEFSKAAYGESQITPARMAKDGRIYVRKSENDGPEGLYLMDPKTNEFETVLQHDLVDIEGTRVDWQGNLYAAFLTPDYLKMEVLDETHPSGRLTKMLQATFKDGVPFIGRTTHDFRYSVVSIEQDTASPTWYLFDSETNQLQQLFDVLPWVDDAKLPEMEPVVIEARDGLELHGYLTVPKGAEKKDLPLVVVPHGGPHGPRDSWGFQWFEGFIPANGYAMLQVNFRGSGGYGREFENKGFKEWGKKMQDDVTDATQWAIDQGIADPDRICIWGWSYGGYAALMGVIREPDLYACAVGGAGVYRHKIQFDSDFGEGTRWGRKYLEKVIGDAEAMEAASPVNYVERIKTPVLLIHGDADRRVPVEHAYALQKAYRDAGKDAPRLIELKNEPHSPRNPKNIRRYQKESIEFFQKHIGEGVMPSG